MLCFAGLGLSGFESISLETSELLKKADMIYLEEFTSPIPKSEIKKFQNNVTNEFKVVKRWMVEDGKEILENSKNKLVVLLAYGDPFIATTHIELRTRAIQENIKTKSIHSASAITSLIGESGLHFYKIGKIVTIMKDLKTMNNAYYSFYNNVLQGLHSVFLLEYDQEKEFFLSPNAALSSLMETEKEQNRNIVSDSTFAIIASRIGLENQKIVGGNIKRLVEFEFGDPPHSIILPGRFHFTETDALKVLGECLDEPVDNSNKIKKISVQMIGKYVPMVREALKEIAPYYHDSKEFHTVLENAELYIRDAEKFLEEGKDEVAILSIGYADGLVDSLRMVKGFEPKM